MWRAGHPTGCPPSTRPPPVEDEGSSRTHPAQERPPTGHGTRAAVSERSGSGLLGGPWSYTSRAPGAQGPAGGGRAAGDRRRAVRADQPAGASRGLKRRSRVHGGGARASARSHPVLVLPPVLARSPGPRAPPGSRPLPRPSCSPGSSHSPRSPVPSGGSAVAAAGTAVRRSPRTPSPRTGVSDQASEAAVADLQGAAPLPGVSSGGPGARARRRRAGRGGAQTHGGHPLSVASGGEAATCARGRAGCRVVETARVVVAVVRACGGCRRPCPRR
ncbi:hypothetical protein SGLAM104S_02553 [Streptomyces glaucescens]